MTSGSVTTATGQHVQRESRRGNPDARAVRTRARLAEALTGLLAADPTGLPTVSQLIASAGVSRNAFYSHFGGMDDVLWEVVREQMATAGTIDLRLRTEGGLSDVEIARAALHEFIDGLLQHRHLYRALFATGSAGRGYRELLDQVADQTEQAILRIREIPPSVRRREAAYYIAGGELTAIGRWLQGSEPLDTDELVEQLVSMMPPWLTRDRPSAHRRADPPRE